MKFRLRNSERYLFEYRARKGCWIIIYFSLDYWEINFVASKVAVVKFQCALDAVLKK